MSVKLVSITPDAEKTMGYIARVSNPANQDNPEVAKLLSYCIKHQHWSVFEQAFMTLEITTGRDISPQILRHRSFTFQEYSQRYAAANEVVYRQARRQDSKNRQNSLDDLSQEVKEWFAGEQERLAKDAFATYENALKLGIAKECARALLPAATKTTLYMSGNVRNWIHYIQLRSDVATQLEHREIALAAKQIFIEQLPIVAKALGWVE
jgi:thymidylate synthase (FAD)